MFATTMVVPASSNNNGNTTLLQFPNYGPRHPNRGQRLQVDDDGGTTMVVVAGSSIAVVPLHTIQYLLLPPA